MGEGLSILVWDGYGAGLVKINPRLIVKGEDCYGNDKNWFPYNDEKEKEKLIEELTDGYTYFEIIK